MHVLRATPFAKRAARAGGVVGNSCFSTSAIDGAAAMLCDRLCRTLAPRYGVSIDMLRALVRPELTQRIGTGHTWPADGDDGKSPLVILSGWACEQRILECGRRQIFSFLLAGVLRYYVARWPLDAYRGAGHPKATFDRKMIIQHKFARCTSGRRFSHATLRHTGRFAST